MNRGETHLRELCHAADGFSPAMGRLARWGRRIAQTLLGGGRVLVAGNGGSAAQAQHMAAELVGKLREDRVPLSAVALSADSSAVTAIANDYGYDEVFARQVRAHGRPGDILILLSTSGKSPNVLRAAEAGAGIGLHTWALTGALRNPLAQRCDEVVAVPSDDGQVVQELHLVAVHVLCSYVDSAVAQLQNAQSQDAQPPSHVLPEFAA
jgi:D-sedoheptulose 7-phosphate isomerase